MLELIFQGLIEWIYGLVLESWQFFVGAVLEVFSMDFAYMQSHVPVIDAILQVCMIAGWALLIGNLVFQALKSMATGLGFEGEDPQLLFTRTFIFSFLLLASPQICEMGLSITAKIITLLQIPDAVDIIFPDAGVFGGLGAAWILVVIVGIIIMFKVLQLVFEIAERYVVLSVLTITAPLAFAMGGSRSTSDIFTGWCRMYGSMCLVMCTNVIFFKMLLSILSSVPTGLAVLPWMVLVMSIVKVAKKIDNIITRIGLNPAITGDSLGRSFPGMLAYTVMRSMTSQVVKTVGKSGGGSGAGAKGPAGKAPPSGGSGTHFGAGFSGGGRRSASGGPGHASSYQQQSTTTAGGSAQTSNQQTATQEQTVNAGTTQNSQQKQASATRSSQTSRRSSVNMQSQRGAWKRQPGATAPAGTGSQFSGLGSAEKGGPQPGVIPPAGSPSGITASAGRSVPPTAGVGHQGRQAPMSGHLSTPNDVAGAAPAGAARFTQQGTQISREGGSQSSVSAKEQNHAVNNTTVHAAPPSAKVAPTTSPPPAGKPPTPTTPAVGSPPQRVETRFSQASKAAEVPPAPQAPTTPAGMDAAPASHAHSEQRAPHMGSAGGATALQQSARPGRNTRNTGAPAAAPPVIHTSAQLPQTPGTFTPRPGPAGSTVRTDSAGKVTQQARHEAAKSPIMPGSSAGGRTVTHGTTQQKQAQAGGVKGARKTQGGKKHGQ